MKVVGSNPGAVYWMDMTFFHIDLLRELHCLLEKTKNKQKKMPVLAQFLKYQKF